MEKWIILLLLFSYITQIKAQETNSDAFHHKVFSLNMDYGSWTEKGGHSYTTIFKPSVEFGKMVRVRLGLFFPSVRDSLLSDSLRQAFIGIGFHYPFKNEQLFFQTNFDGYPDGIILPRVSILGAKFGGYRNIAESKASISFYIFYNQWFSRNAFLNQSQDIGFGLSLNL